MCSGNFVMAEECLDDSALWRVHRSQHRIVSELRFSGQLSEESIYDSLRSREKRCGVRMLIVLCARAKSIGDGREEPFLRIIFIRDRFRLARELLKKCNELSPSFLPVALCC